MSAMDRRQGKPDLNKSARMRGVMAAQFLTVGLFLNEKWYHRITETPKFLQTGKDVIVIFILNKVLYIFKYALLIEHR